MPTTRLVNYLKRYRRISGLSQREVAFLLGCKHDNQISRYEKRRQSPPLRTALALESVFRVPLSDLYAGLKDSVETETEKRLRKLDKELQTKVGPGRAGRLSSRKMQWLARQHPSVASNLSIVQ